MSYLPGARVFFSGYRAAKTSAATVHRAVRLTAKYASSLWKREALASHTMANGNAVMHTLLAFVPR